MEDLIIRPAVRGDAAAMAAIYNQAVLRSTATFDTEPETPEAREGWLAEHTAPQHPVLVAERDGHVRRMGVAVALLEPLRLRSRPWRPPPTSTSPRPAAGWVLR